MSLVSSCPIKTELSERLLIGVQSQAMLEGAFERTRQYTKDRQVFGKPLVKLQVSRKTAILVLLHFRPFNTVLLRSRQMPPWAAHSAIRRCDSLWKVSPVINILSSSLRKLQITSTTLLHQWPSTGSLKSHT